jgi:sugar diacid utilization regulator
VIVRRLLAGEPLDGSALGYEFEGMWHHGIVASGSSGKEVIQSISQRAEHRKLIVSGGPDVCWGWLAGREPMDTRQLAADAKRLGRPQTTIAIAEPSPGIAGWRLTHRQGRAALAVALKRGDRVVRYADVALTASLLQDELLSASLRSIYLAPLAEDRDGGDAARQILRAYFRTGRNVSSAAAALGINRQTATKRLRSIDDLLDGALTDRSADLEVALRLEELVPSHAGNKSASG